MTIKTLFLLAFAALLLYGCGPDESVGETCLPKYIWRMGDSLSYQYDADKRLIAIVTYHSKKQTQRDDYTYTNGRLTGVKTSVGASAPMTEGFLATLEYGTDGLPSRKTEKIYPTSIQTLTTEFTHDSNGRLIKGTITEKLDAPFNTLRFVASYVYEYNSAGNVSVVKYLIPDFSNNGQTKEVLARENLKFDDRPVFWAGSEDLTLLNVYVYRHLPNVNNVLQAKIPFPNYDHQVSPANALDFRINYNEKNLMIGYQPPIGATTGFGDLFFAIGGYECF